MKSDIRTIFWLTTFGTTIIYIKKRYLHENQSNKEIKKSNMSIREKIVTKVVAKWIFKYHFSYYIHIIPVILILIGDCTRCTSESYVYAGHVRI